jgi:hypothetical protein
MITLAHGETSATRDDEHDGHGRRDRHRDMARGIQEIRTTWSLAVHEPFEQDLDGKGARRGHEGGTASQRLTHQARAARQRGATPHKTKAGPRGPAVSRVPLGC